MENDLNLSTFAQAGIGKLFIEVKNSITCKITSEPFTQQCKLLTHICFYGFQIDDSVVTNLSRAMQEGKLPVLSHFTIGKCQFNIRGKLSQLFSCQWPTLKYLNLNSSYLDRSDIKILSSHGTLLPKLSSLMLYFGCVTDCFIRETLLKHRQLPAEYSLPERRIENSILSMFMTYHLSMAS